MQLLPTLTAIIVVLQILPAAAGDPCGPGHMRRAEVRGGTLELRWEGRIEQPMSADIAAEFAQHRQNTKAVTLSLASCGGDGLAMERAVDVLRDIKTTHVLTTVVGRGDKCGSACIAVFLAGSHRIGALASLWFFHPAGKVPNGSAEQGDVRAYYTDDYIRRYFSPAGVSEDWIQFMRRSIRAHDLWQTGRDLWDAKSGILTETMGNLAPREGDRIDLPPVTVCEPVCRG